MYIKDLVQDTLRRLDYKQSEVEKVAVSLPKNPRWGDYSTNCAFLIGEREGMKPEEAANRIAQAIPRDVFDSIEVISGFINLTLKRDFLLQFVREASRSGLEYASSDSGKGKSVLIEFVSANPTGPLVVANARAAAIGDSLRRIFRHCGYAAESEFYVDDAGRQVELLGLSVEARLRELLGQEAKIPEDGYAGDYCVDLARDLLSQSDRLLSLPPQERVSEFKEYALKKMLEWQKGSLEKFGVIFDNWAHESSFRGKAGTDRLLETLKEKGNTFEDGGAIWFRSTDYGDERDRVLKKSTGDLTYLVPDSVYHAGKFDRGFDRIIDLFGPDHVAQVPSLKAVLKALGYPGERLEVTIVQWVTLIQEGKKLGMSKRGGTFITMDELVSEVGKDAARFFFLMRKPSSHLDFDIDLAKKTSEENPVYYVQYAHARICSILAYAKERGMGSAEIAQADLAILSEPEERDLMLRIASFIDVVGECLEDLSPHRIPFFLQDLSASFHNFYHKHRVVTEDIPLSRARLFLCDAMRATIASGLNLIGVSAPEKM
jgi:arginyl-tRNA synthetase